MDQRPPQDELTRQRSERATVIAQTGDLTKAVEVGLIPRYVGLTLSEALVLGLWQQGVRHFFAVFGHGSTEVGEVLRVYQQAGLLKTYGLRSEIEASHAAAALRWVYGEKAAVVTSIGPGALQALAASLVPASNGVGVWYLFGDETTEDEGYNMQQVPKHHQGLFSAMTAAMGRTYTLHTPLSLPTALQRGGATVDHPTRPGPFYLLIPMNTQPSWLPNFNLAELPQTRLLTLGAAQGDYRQAVDWINQADCILVKVGGGGRQAGPELVELVERTGAVLVHTPVATGCIPYSHPRNMGVGGSKGSICGNYAMEEADLLIAVGTRAVCQSDSSRTGYPNVKRVINFNADLDDVLHYNQTLAFLGDVRATLARLLTSLEPVRTEKSAWVKTCEEKKAVWQDFKQLRYDNPKLYGPYWDDEVLTQPAVIKVATDWARQQDAVCFFDAGDVQANGFQIVEDQNPRQTFTDTGASYMGFAVSALLANVAASNPKFGLALTGDGSFTMNPQILIDGLQYGARGCILLLDNGRMGAITGLQEAQYQAGFATWNTIKVDYLAWARSVQGLLALDSGRSVASLQAALAQAGDYQDLSLVHVPVYFGSHELGGMGVYGRWNVGNWCDETQALRHKIGL